jgi:hypothetical protein
MPPAPMARPASTSSAMMTLSRRFELGAVDDAVALTFGLPPAMGSV